jgi:cellulase (glycosyl hydrolase family 5)
MPRAGEAGRSGSHRGLVVMLMGTGAALLAACGSSGPTTPSPSASPGASREFIGVAADGWNFAYLPSGRVFVPVGVNYDHDQKPPCPRLLEEYWDNEWAEVEADFREIAQLGFNAVRIHLQLAKFVSAPGVANEASLRQLDRLMQLAHQTGLVLNVTGLGLYRADEIPRWFSTLSDDQATEVEAFFWRTLAARYRDESAIFAYDLQNEPFISAVDTSDWVSAPFAPCDPDAGGPLPARGFSYVHLHYRLAGPRWGEFVRRKYESEAALRAAWPDYPRPGESRSDPARPSFGTSRERARDHLEFRHQLAREWTSRLLGAIRETDSRHLVSIGLTEGALPFQDDNAANAREFLLYSAYSPLHLADLLSYVNVHVYPRRYGAATNVDLAELVLRGAHVGKPVVLQETFPQIDGPDFDRFLARSRRSVSGWFSFYWGKTPAELRGSGTLADAILADWIERYSAFARGVPAGGVTREAPQATVQVSIEAQLWSQAERIELVRQYAGFRARDSFLDPRLQP